MKRILLICFMLLTALVTESWAQDRTVSGTVKDESGEALPGVNIILKGTTTGATSDIDGNWRLSLPSEGGTLVFQFVGMATQEIAVGSRSVIDVTMAADATELAEVVVTAVGIERQTKALGYAVQNVDGEAIQQVSEPDPLRALNGKVAGVNILSSNGLPGGSTSMTIRGFSSLQNNNQPLFVVDGVPFDNSQFDTKATSAGSIPNVASSNRLLDLDPNSIESITVLKGGAASALYGSRAANGVVVITTKAGSTSGSKGLEISLGLSYSLEEYANAPDIQTTHSQGGDFQFNPGFVGSWGDNLETLNAQGGIPHPLAANYSDVFPEYADILIPAETHENAKDFFDTGHVLETSLQISTGGENTRLNAGFSRMTNNGIAPNTSFDRYSFNAGGSAELENGLHFNGSLNYVKSEQESVQIGTPLGVNNTSIMTRLLWTPTTVNLKDMPYINPIDNSNVYYRTDQDNPYWLAHTSPYTSDVNRLFGQFSLSYDITDWMTLSYRIGMNAYTDRRKNVIAAGSAVVPNGEIIEDNIYREEVDGVVNLSLSKDLSETFGISANLGFNHNQRKTERQSIMGTGIITFGIHDLDNTSVQLANGGSNSLRRLMGFYADITGDFNDWAFLTLTGRRDYSSTLPQDNNAFNYGAVSVAAVVTDALGIQSDILSFAKVRASISRVGNDADPYLTQSIYLTNPVAGLGNGNLGLPFSNSSGSYNVLTQGNTIGNNELKPEFTTESEVGLDLRFLNSRISLDFAYYIRNTTDQIVPIDVAASSGSNRFITNLGEVQNKGIEITLNADLVEVSGFNWNMTHTFTQNKSEITDLGDLDEVFVGGFIGLGIVHRQGEPYGQILGTDFERDADDGLPLLQAGGGSAGRFIETPADRVIGDPNPDFQWTMNNTFSYKGISLSFLLDWKKGGDQFCFSCDQIRSRGVVAETSILNRDAPVVIPGYVAALDEDGNWVAATDEDGQKVRNTTQISMNDFYFIDGVTWADSHDVYDISTIRLREVTLSYNFPKSLLSKTPFGSASLSFSGRNLWYEAYNMPTSLNYDPEVSSGVANARGLDFSTVPTTKRYGVNLRFTF